MARAFDVVAADCERPAVARARPAELEARPADGA